MGCQGPDSLRACISNRSYLVFRKSQSLEIYSYFMSKYCIYIYLYIFFILKTTQLILMKPTLLTGFEDEKAIWLGLDHDKAHLFFFLFRYKAHLNCSFLN